MFQFSHFKTAADIPAHFLRRCIRVNGVVTNVSVSSKGNVVLSVNHTPIVSLWSARNFIGHIPVRVASVSVDPEQKSKALASAEATLAGARGKVRFCPLSIRGDTLNAIVYVNRRVLRNVDLGRSLVSLGLASPAPFDTGLAGHKTYEKYYALLVKLENAASKREIGMWQHEKEEENTPSLWSRVLKRMFKRRKK